MPHQQKGFLPSPKQVHTCFLSVFFFFLIIFGLFTEMRIYFRKDFAKCMCYECYYEINVVKWNDMKIYQNMGLTIENKK